MSCAGQQTNFSLKFYKTASKASRVFSSSTASILLIDRSRLTGSRVAHRLEDDGTSINNKVRTVDVGSSTTGQ